MHRRRGKLSWLLLILVIAVLGVFTSERGGKDLIPWRTDFDAARREAGAAHKDVLIDFSASWCEPCQQMKRFTWSDKKVAAAAEKFVPLAVDTDKNPQLVYKYHIGPIPAILIVRADDGSVLRALVGMPESNDDFVAWLQK